MKYVKGYRNCQRRKSVIFIIVGLLPISQNQLFNPTIAIINKVITPPKKKNTKKKKH